MKKRTLFIKKCGNCDLVSDMGDGCDSCGLTQKEIDVEKMDDDCPLPEINMSMMKNVIETYKCLISCREKMPGMKLEDAFKSSSGALQAIKDEHEWLKSLNLV